VGGVGGGGGGGVVCGWGGWGGGCGVGNLDANFLILSFVGVALSTFPIPIIALPAAYRTDLTWTEGIA